MASKNLIVATETFVKDRLANEPTGHDQLLSEWEAKG